MSDPVELAHSYLLACDDLHSLERTRRKHNGPAPDLHDLIDKLEEKITILKKQLLALSKEQRLIPGVQIAILDIVCDYDFNFGGVYNASYDASYDASHEYKKYLYEHDIELQAYKENLANITYHLFDFRKLAIVGVNSALDIVKQYYLTNLQKLETKIKYEIDRIMDSAAITALQIVIDLEKQLDKAIIEELLDF